VTDGWRDLTDGAENGGASHRVPSEGRRDAPGDRAGRGGRRADERRASDRRAADQYRAIFEATFEQAAVGIAQVALDGRWLRANQKLADILGYPRQELLSLTLQDITHPNDLGADLDRVTALLAGEADTYAMEKRYVRRDGSTVWSNLTVSLVRDAETDAPLYFISIIEDITDRKRLEAERLALLESERRALAECEQVTRRLERSEAGLRESEARFRELAESIGAVFYVSTADGARIEYASPGYREIWGRDQEELYRDTSAWLAAVHPDDRERVATARARMPLGGYDEEYRVVRPDGTVRRVRDRAFPVRDADGRVLRNAGIAEDITDRRRTEERLSFLTEASRALAASLDYRATLASVARLAVVSMADYCVVSLFNASGRLELVEVTHANPAWREALWRVASSHIFDPEGPTVLARAVRTGEAQIVSDVPDTLLSAVVPGEEQRQTFQALGGLASYIVTPLVVGGRVIGAISFGRASSSPAYESGDLELAQELARRTAVAVENARLYQAAEVARAQAEAASHAKSAFLATMSHELRTPLSALLGYSELLDLGVEGPLTAGQRHYLDRMKASGRHLLGLINEVLDLAKLEAGQMTVSPAARPADAAAQDALALVRPQAAARSLELRLDADCGDTRYLGDDVRVRQVLTNLLSNAVKFTEPGGKVTLVCRRVAELDSAADERHRAKGPGPWIAFQVIDTGIGIAPEKLDAIFEPFIQVQDTLTRPYGGTGLGLTISRRLARLMGGEITAESRLGEGSQFTLWLPAAPDQPGAFSPASGEQGDRVAIGEALATSVPDIVKRFADRLRADPDIPEALEASRTELENHVASFLADIAQQVTILDEYQADRVPLIRDGTAIQQLIAERHGAQRWRLGWSEQAARREFDVLRGEVEAAVRHALAPFPHAGLEDVIALLALALREAEEMSMRGYRTARSEGRETRGQTP